MPPPDIPPRPSTTMRGDPINEIPARINDPSSRSLPQKRASSSARSLLATAPKTSHISRFAIQGTELYVVFKDEETGGETDTYRYDFVSKAEAMDIFQRMKDSRHPYGNVLYPDVIAEGNTGHPI